jgi:hypothetical protein
MSVTEVKKWNGQAYDAIVLAGCFITDQITIGAENVYLEIGASGNMLKNYRNRLASEDQCQKACDLLTEMILCICNTFHLRTDLHQNLRKADKDNSKKWDAALTKLESNAPVPVSKKWDKSMNVRKISFSHCTTKCIRAPDPVLLLAKATKIWLKRHDIELLPGCDDANSATSDDNSGYTVTKTELCIDEIGIYVDSIKEVDEPLSDDDT